MANNTTTKPLNQNKMKQKKIEHISHDMENSIIFVV